MNLGSSRGFDGRITGLDLLGRILHQLDVKILLLLA
jgi:hypothetical protein